MEHSVRAVQGHNQLSAYRGVFWDPTSCKWQATISDGLGCQCLGLFDDESEAARVVDAAAHPQGANNAALNLPLRQVRRSGAPLRPNDGGAVRVSTEIRTTHYVPLPHTRAGCRRAVSLAPLMHC